MDGQPDGEGARRTTVGAMRVVVHPSVEAMAAGAAAEAAGVLCDAVAARGRAHAMFATGNSQLAFVDALATRSEIPWDSVVVFHMDEYVGVGPDHPAGFRRWIRTRIVERLHPAEAHYLDGLAEPTAEAARYAALLEAHPLDLCCLGIGQNGHLAFNDPPVADFDDPLGAKVVTLDPECRQQQVDEGHFPDPGSVPAEAVTVTIPALLAARRVLAIVPESRKARPVRAALSGPVTTDCPASVLRTRANVTLHLEPESAALL